MDKGLLRKGPGLGLCRETELSGTGCPGLERLVFVLWVLGLGRAVWVVGLRQTSSGVVAAESVQVTRVLCGRSIPLALFGRYGPLLSGGFPLGIAAYAGLPVLLGAGGAAGLAGSGRFGAVPAVAKFPGCLPFLLGAESLVLHALGSLVSGSVILGPVPLPVFRQGGVGLGPGVWRGFGGIPGLGVFPGGFSCCLLVLRGVSRVGWLGDGEAELEGMAYCTWRRGNPQTPEP